jgi:3-dehydroquinate dehydratase-2
MSAEIQVPLMSVRSGEPSSERTGAFFGPQDRKVSTKTAWLFVVLAAVAAAGITVAIMLSVGFHLPDGAVGAGGQGAMRVLVLNGLGLDVRGQTEASRLKFGSSAVYSDYVKIAKDSARELGVEVEVRQSNNEAEFVHWVRTAAQEGFDAMLMNPSGFLKSAAVGAAVGEVGMPFFEVHYSNVLAKGLVTTVGQNSTGVFYGNKLLSYRYALIGAAATDTKKWTQFDYPPSSSITSKLLG